MKMIFEEQILTTPQNRLRHIATQSYIECFFK